jgi:hypothetical protein
MKNWHKILFAFITNLTTSFRDESYLPFAAVVHDENAFIDPASLMHSITESSPIFSYNKKTFIK